MLHDQGVLVFDVAPSPQAATHATSHFSYPPTPPGVAPACAVTRSVELRRVRGCGMRLAQLAGRLRGQLADAAAPSPAPPRGGWLGPPSEPPLQDAALPAVDLPPKEGAVRCGAVRQEVAAAVLRGRGLRRRAPSPIRRCASRLTRHAATDRCAASINALLLASSLSQHRCRESRYASASMAMWAVDPHRGARRAGLHPPPVTPSPRRRAGARPRHAAHLAGRTALHVWRPRPGHRAVRPGGHHSAARERAGTHGCRAARGARACCPPHRPMPSLTLRGSPQWVSPELRAQLAVAAAPTADAHSSSWGQAEQAAHARALRALRALLAPLLPACT